jgi:hypothetical protein
MSEEIKQPAPPTHSNVFSGEALEKLIKDGFKSNGVVHRFGMTWPCGHTGDAVEIVHESYGCVKACDKCGEQYGLK